MPDVPARPENDPRPGNVKAVVIIAALFVAFTALPAYLGLGFLLSADSTTGTIENYSVIQKARSRPGGKLTLIYPWASYQLPDGAKVTGKSRISQSWFTYDIGDEVTVFYNPDKPTEIQVGYWSDFLALAILIAVLPFFLLFYSVADHYWKRKKAHANNKKPTPPRKGSSPWR